MTDDTISVSTERYVTLSRRQLVSGLAAGTVVALSGCVENPELGRRQLLLVSDDQLSQLAVGAWQQMRQQERVSRDPALNRRLATIGDRIVNASGLTNYNWEYTVFENDQVNAFVMPGGKVGFYTGILDIMANDSQVATVMGHEVGHVAGRHAAERYSQSAVANLGVQAVSAGLQAGDVSYAREIAGVLGAGVTFGIILPYSRQHEFEADRLGVRYMDAARYDPREALTFWQGMSARHQSNRLAFMSTHPSDENRIAAMQQQIARLV